MSLISYLPIFLSSQLNVYLLLFSLTTCIKVILKKISYNRVIPHILLYPKSQDPNSSNPIYFCKTRLRIYLCPTASEVFHFFPRTKTGGCISVQSNTCHIHRPSHPPVRSTIQIMTVLITLFYSLTFSQLHLHIYLCSKTNLLQIWLVK